MPDEVSAFGRREELQRDGDQVADVVKGPGTGGAEKRFQFRERQFDRIEVGTVGRKEAELGADGFDGGAHRRLFVDGEVVEDDHVARLQRGTQHLLDVGEEASDCRSVRRRRQGAESPSRRNAATTVCVSQWPQGA